VLFALALGRARLRSFRGELMKLRRFALHGGLRRLRWTLLRRSSLLVLRIARLLRLGVAFLALRVAILTRSAILPRAAVGPAIAARLAVALALRLLPLLTAAPAFEAALLLPVAAMLLVAPAFVVSTLPASIPPRASIEALLVASALLVAPRLALHGLLGALRRLLRRRCRGLVRGFLEQAEQARQEARFFLGRRRLGRRGLVP